MNFNQYTIKSQELIQQAAQIAQGFSQQAVETGHLLKAILEEEPNTSSFLLKKYGISPEGFLKKLDPIVEAYPRVSGGNQPFLGNDLNKAMTKAQTYLKEFGDEFISVELLFLGILGGNDQTANLLKSIRNCETEQIFMVISVR